MRRAAHRDDPDRLVLQRLDRGDVEQVFQHAREARAVDRRGDQHRPGSGDARDRLTGRLTVSIKGPAVADLDRRIGEIEDIDREIGVSGAGHLRGRRDRGREPAGRRCGADQHQQGGAIGHQQPPSAAPP